MANLTSLWACGEQLHCAWCKASAQLHFCVSKNFTKQKKRVNDWKAVNSLFSFIASFAFVLQMQRAKGKPFSPDSNELTLCVMNWSLPASWFENFVFMNWIALLWCTEGAIHEQSSIHGANQFMPARAVHYGHARITYVHPSLSRVPIKRCLFCSFLPKCDSLNPFADKILCRCRAEHCQVGRFTPRRPFASRGSARGRCPFFHTLPKKWSGFLCKK